MQLYCIFHKNKTGSTKLPPLSSIIFTFIFIIIFMSLYIFVFIFISSLMVNRQTDRQHSAIHTSLHILKTWKWSVCYLYIYDIFHDVSSRLVLSCFNFSFPVFTTCLTLFVLFLLHIQYSLFLVFQIIIFHFIKGDDGGLHHQVRAEET